VPEPARLAIRKIDTELLLQDARGDPELLIMLRQIAMVNLIFTFIILYSS